MEIPFAVEHFFSVFETYNEAIWPAQIVAYVVSTAAVIFLFKQTRWSGRFITGTLALLWIWIGAVYHILHFSAINPLALFFGVLFIVQGIILAVFGIVFNRLDFGRKEWLNTIVGSLFIVFSMLVYPLLGYALGHKYPGTPMFGVAPCPATIFTFGIFLFARSKIPWYLFILPLLWSIVGMSAAIKLQVPQDYGLFVSGIIGTIMILRNNSKRKKRSNHAMHAGGHSAALHSRM